MNKKTLLGLLLMGLFWPTLGVLAEDYNLYPVGPFGTLNNTDNPIMLGNTQSQDLLNVEISKDGRYVKRREGYSISDTMAITTSAVHGIYNFKNTSGQNVSLFFNDTRITSSINNAVDTVIYSTGPNGKTYDCVDYNGKAYCVNTGQSNLFFTDGVSMGNINPAQANSTGTMITATPGRLVMSGNSNNANTVFFSKDGDFTTWTIGTADTDPMWFLITSPGSKITHICYAFDKVIWFKDSSFGYIAEGATQADWQIGTLNSNLGTEANESVYYNGILYFRGNDNHFYSFDGSNLTKLSGDINNTIKNIGNLFTPTGRTSSAVMGSGTYSQTSGSIVSGSVVLSTMVETSFTDTNFANGTHTNTSSSVVAGYLYLDRTSEEKEEQATDNGFIYPGCGAPYYAAVRFQATSSYKLTTIYLRGTRTSTSFDSYTMRLMTNSGSNVPGSVLASNTNVNLASFPISPTVDWRSFSIPETNITNGTVYWIQLIPNNIAGCGTYTGFYWHINSTSGGDTKYVWNATEVEDQQPDFKTYGYTYETSGNYISENFDVGTTTNTWLWNWGNFSKSDSASDGTAVSYETQTASATTGTWTSLVSATDGSQVGSTVQRYIRFKASLTSPDSRYSPNVSHVTMPTSLFRKSTGTYVSASSSLGTALTTWAPISIKSSLNGGTIVYNFVGSSYAAFDYTTACVILDGQTPSVSTMNYCYISATFTITNATQTAQLNSVTYAWIEGGQTDKSYAIAFDDKIWWSVMYGDNQSTNNRLLVYDIANQGWLFHDIPSNGFLIKNNSLYFGSPTSGYVYKFGGVHSDNGSSITSYWRSKDYFMDNPFTEKEYPTLSAVTNSYQTTSSITYTLNGSTSTSYSYSIYNSSGLFTQYNRNLPVGKVGKTISVQYGNSAADQYWELFGMQIGWRPKPWKPTP